MDLPLLPDGIEALHALRDGGGYPEAEQYFTSGMTRTEQTLPPCTATGRTARSPACRRCASANSKERPTRT